MRHRLKSAGFLGALLALIGPELAITTASVILTPAVAEAQVGGVHRRTRRRTRRRTAAVVHTADMNQAAAQQKEQTQSDQQSQLPAGKSDTVPGSGAAPAVAINAEVGVGAVNSTDAGVAEDGVARAPPSLARNLAHEAG